MAKKTTKPPTKKPAATAKGGKRIQAGGLANALGFASKGC